MAVTAQGRAAGDGLGPHQLRAAVVRTEPRTHAHPPLPSEDEEPPA